MIKKKFDPRRKSHLTFKNVSLFEKKASGERWKEINDNNKITYLKIDKLVSLPDKAFKTQFIREKRRNLFELDSLIHKIVYKLLNEAKKQKEREESNGEV